MARPDESLPPLAPPARYFPLTRGVYDVTAGLRPLGTDFGQGVMDGRVFQVDAEWPRYRANKLACRAERTGKYVARADLDEPATVALRDWFVGQLTAAYPDRFLRQGPQLHCHLSGDIVPLNGDPFDVFDGLAMQVQEDVCLCRADEGRDWLAAGHVCSPSHWGIERKIGRPFTAIHEPVPGIGNINRSAAAYVRTMIDRGPFVRFAWGFATDERLNHHPDPPPGVAADDWRGRRFVPGETPLFLRVERQVMWGLPSRAGGRVHDSRLAPERRGDPRRPASAGIVRLGPAVDVAGGVGVQGAGRVGRGRAGVAGRVSWSGCPVGEADRPR